MVSKSTSTNVPYRTRDWTVGVITSGTSSPYFFKKADCTSTSSFWNLFGLEISVSSCNTSFALSMTLLGMVVTAHGTFWTLRFWCNVLIMTPFNSFFELLYSIIGNGIKFCKCWHENRVWWRVHVFIILKNIMFNKIW